MNPLRACITLAALTPAAAADVTISDGTFDPGDWNHVILWHRPTASLGPMTQEPAGGNPGSWQRGRHVSQGAFAAIYDGHFYLPGVYNPATQGAITSLDVQYDYIDLGQGNTQNGLAVEQGGNWYIRYVDSSLHAAWTTLGQNAITQNDNQWMIVSPANPPTQGFPDFSATGAPLRFGYYTFTWSLPQGFVVERIWGIDNFRVVVHQEACYADCDTSTGPRVLDIFDFLCFQNRYEQRAPYACDCDTSTGLGVCDVFDFLCFQNAYAAGCP